MAEERRATNRVRISGVRVTYESATGERIEADALDLGGGGVFVRTAAPLAVGKRIALEIQVIGETGPWAAIGRVVWARTKGEGAQAPPGMGVKLIDADEAVFAAIERLVDTRESTQPGVGKPSSPPPGPAPVVAVAPERERTLMGVGASEEPAQPPRAAAFPESSPNEPVPLIPREPSVAIDLVARKAPMAPLAPQPPHPLQPSQPLQPARPGQTASPEIDRGGGAGRWIVIVLLLVVAGVAAYVLLDGFLSPPAGR